MKIFILTHVSNLTDRYHSGGGLVIIAKDIDEAKKLISIDKDILPTEEEWGNAIIYDLKYKNVKEEYFIFQDAGCC